MTGEKGRLNSLFAEWLFEQRRISAQSNVLQSDVLEQHEKIFLAIEARDPNGALVAMEKHLQEVTKNYWSAMVHWGHSHT